MTRAGQLARAELTPDGFWLREGIRYGLALGIAIAIALAGNVPHAFWVALGTLSVLRSNALSTGYTVAQSLLGTFIGFLAAAGLVSITSSDWFLWTLLPIAVFLSAYTPSAVHFVLGQASFTIFVVVLFNLLEPQGWKTGLVRLGDIAVGTVVSLVVSVVFWPRGASATLRTTAMQAIAAGGRFIATAAEARVGRPAGHPAEAEVVRARRAAIGADRRAGEAYVAFLGERGKRRMPADTGASLISVGLLLQLAGVALDATTAPTFTGASFDTAGGQLAAEADELARRLERPEAAAPAAESWVGRDTASLAACIADPAAADAAPDIVSLAWVGAWLRHVGFLADRAAGGRAGVGGGDIPPLVGGVAAVAWTAMPATDLDQIVNLCKRRGFVYPSAEIYGGFRSAYDYGPLGALMLRNIKDAWIRSMVQKRDDVVLIDAADPRPAAGVGGQRPPRQLHRPARRLHQLQEPLPARQARRPEHVPELRQARHVHRGPPVQPDVQDPRRPGRGRRRRSPTCARRRRRACSSTSATCCRPTRKKPPFGIAQVGKSFRNEITPQNWIFRTREFEQMEMEFFVPPAESAKWYEYWCDERLDWYVRPRHPGRHAAPARPRRRRAVALLGRHVRRRVPVPVGLGRARGHRPAHRLRPQAAHAALGGEARLLRPGRPTSATRRTSSSRRPAPRARWPPSCCRPTTRTWSTARRAPCCGCIPASRRTRSPCCRCRRRRRSTPLAHEVRKTLSERYMVDYDETQAIGRRYRRQDEIGTPLCVTVDFDSLDDKAVTIRDRDTTEQVRVPIDDLAGRDRRAPRVLSVRGSSAPAVTFSLHE